MTAKEIYQTIKERPHRDGEALIIQYAKDFAANFCKWEEVHSGNFELADGYIEKKIEKYLQIESSIK